MRWIVFCVMLIVPALALALAQDPPPVEFAKVHADVVVWVFGLILTGLGYFILRAIRQNDRAIEDNGKAHEDMLSLMREESQRQWSAIDRITRDLGKATADLSRLRGQHDAYVAGGYHLHRRQEDDGE
jgi:uncharacterized protein YneF (UPF0154 family)